MNITAIAEWLASRLRIIWKFLHSLEKHKDGKKLGEALGQKALQWLRNVKYHVKIPIADPEECWKLKCLV